MFRLNVQNWFVRSLQANRWVVLSLAAALILSIGLVDWRLDVNISFGFLYLFPMLMVGSCLQPLQIVMVAALCTGLCEAFDTFPWDQAVGIPRLILTFAAFFGAGLYVQVSTRNQRLVSAHLDELEREAALRRAAEEQLEFLIDSSPASILTMDTDGRILIANDAAHRLLGVEPGQLPGRRLTDYLPVLKRVPPPSANARQFRTSMQGIGRREDGEVFLAQIWFSTYRTVSGPRLAAVVLDGSDELRDREEWALQQLMTGSRILVGAVCHEIRNICGAIGVVRAHLARDPQLAAGEDFRALGTLVDALGRMAGIELRHAVRQECDSVPVSEVLEQLRIVIEPPFREIGITMSWETGTALPPVHADRESLLQAFLNLAKNSQKALEAAPRREVRVEAGLEDGRVAVRFVDSGPGVAAPDELFKPFQSGAAGTGLGLYLSRALVRAFGGDIEHRPRQVGCCFAVLLPFQEEEPVETSAIAAGRSRAVSGESRSSA